MFNSELPSQAQLPSSLQLLRSTLLAMIAAAAILVTVVLPAEYGIDPTGIGWKLNLTQMGIIKVQLAEEAAADRAKQTIDSAPPAVQALAESPAAPVTVAPATPVAAAIEPLPITELPEKKRDSLRLILGPGEPAEIKLEMKQGDTVKFRWSANGGSLNYNTHADRTKGSSHTYEKGRFQPGQQGSLTAVFDGQHGWFWRNRTDKAVTLTLEVEGDFLAMKRVI
ncbi:transmembrane anchor protein [Motiliproteus coralliicola]|uniref:Transmembrane anchor protein n=1 Tax=Motiliproteus coralliicola TaxID=2283196 RepID=A0A369WAK2_9GAMM|nr:transmembrane anchor protein [Motiliproteus coralliicola]RDE19040.1 transmembrane anchor protein [Motiliproteus coralliicola]